MALLSLPTRPNIRNSGVMTFMMNQDGVIYERDLGRKPSQVASQSPVQSRQIVAEGSVEGWLVANQTGRRIQRALGRNDAGFPAALGPHEPGAGIRL